jgi:small subunit ribosomal protein S2
MVEIPSLRDMLAAGVHFGHKKARWNPKMVPYIFGTKNGVNIINLEKTREMLEAALIAVVDEINAGKNIVFVTSKRQAKEVVKEAAISCGMPYIAEKWRGGILTNFDVVSKNFKTLKNLTDQMESADFQKISNIEQNKIKEKAEKIERIFGGIATLKKKPDMLFLIGAYDEQIAMKEAIRERIPVVALVDTNANPEEISWPIPANDDATKSIKLLVTTFAKAILEAKPKQTEESNS